MNRILLLTVTAALLAWSTPTFAQCESPQIMLSVDRSSSMTTGSIGGVTKWNIARGVIEEIVTDFDDRIDFGVQVFPSPDRCSPGTVEVNVGPNDAATILSGLGTPPPTGGNYTPMAMTMDVLTSYSGWTPGREKIVALITDGWQYCVPYDSSTRFDVVGSVERLRAMGITVYIIGFGSSVDALTLNRAAVAAGTATAGCDVSSDDPMDPDNCYLIALDRAALRTGLEGIADVSEDEICDGTDNDCDGRVDETFDADGDGFTTCGTRSDRPGPPDMALIDCNDSAPAVFPGATEICDGIDNNCDDVTDPGCDCTSGATRPCGSSTGRCMAGTQRCTAGSWGECTGSVPAIDEVCNGEDDDCDGDIDNGGPDLCPMGSVCEAGRCVDVDEPPVMDPDTDGDGILDRIENPPGAPVPPDTDGDGTPDWLDADDDDDGIPTLDERPSFEDQDTDRDGIPNHHDPDDDGDTVDTRNERPGGSDVDTDGNGLPDHLDVDNDGDGILTANEAPDANGDGNPVDARDSDGDGIPDYNDPDDDNDTVDTRFEAPDVNGDGDPSDARDTDGDGTPDWLDTDDDEDTIPTADENPDPNGDGNPSDAMNTDGDDAANYLDEDDDNDTILTEQELDEDMTPGDDYDMDGTPSYLDTESDGDGALDIDEGDGDDDGDGAPNYLDAGPSVAGDSEGFSGGAGCAASSPSPMSGFALALVMLVGFVRRRR